MASSPYASTEETTNLNRVCRLLLGPCTDQLRFALRRYVHPASLTVTIRPIKHKILPFLSKKQERLVLPEGTTRYRGNYDDMDISLLYTMLRSMWLVHGIPWMYNHDKVKHESAHIESIHFVRNKCGGHATKDYLSHTEFKTYWSTLRSAVENLDNIYKTNYLEGVKFLLTEEMDPVQGQRYREEIRKQYEEEQKTKEMIGKLTKEMEKTGKEVQETKGKVLNYNFIYCNS
ncbi:uncharacterized protein LOC134272323 [Saccostrea cucullata]|uniref:uncharacterized protein LOC134272323 n=1 Tax=Saccostrea cuccullata TaxID=36930 RepID=UPI002ED2FC31